MCVHDIFSEVACVSPSGSVLQEFLFSVVVRCTNFFSCTSVLAGYFFPKSPLRNFQFFCDSHKKKKGSYFNHIIAIIKCLKVIGS